MRPAGRQHLAAPRTPFTAGSAPAPALPPAPNKTRLDQTAQPLHAGGKRAGRCFYPAALSSLHGGLQRAGERGTGLTHRGTAGGLLGESLLFQHPFPAGGRLASEGGGAAAPRKAAASIHSLKSSHTSNRADRLPEISMQPRVVLTLLVVTASSTQWMRDFFRL